MRVSHYFKYKSVGFQFFNVKHQSGPMALSFDAKNIAVQELSKVFIYFILLGGLRNNIILFSNKLKLLNKPLHLR